MSLDEATVARIARLARIAVPEAELAPLAGELSRILEWIEQLNEVDTDGRAADDQRGRDAARLARRRGHRRRPAEDILANAPERQDGYFVVPKVVE